jgi:molecular chaperone DnaK
MAGFKNCYGIDFGTTNSALAGVLEVNGEKKRIQIGDSDGNPFPSLIAIDKITGEIFSGRKAWSKRNELEESCTIISSVKSYLGSNETWNAAGRKWTAEEIASKILLSLKERVRQRKGDELEEAVMAIPVGFSSFQRQSLRKAATMAGIKVKSFISESTAAFYKNFKNLREYSKVAVFDWGGGTLDISIIENRDGDIKELSTAGMPRGGDYIDMLLAEWVHKELMRSGKINNGFMSMPSTARDKLIANCERAKRDLYDSDIVRIALSYGEVGLINQTIDIDTFSELIEPCINEAMECLDRAVKDSGLSKEALECIMMVGGSSNLRPLIGKIEERWSERSHIEYPEESEWHVAEGAAYLSLNPGKFKLNQSLGLTLCDETFFPLVEKGEEITFKVKTHNFAIVDDTLDARFVFTDRKTNLGYVTVPTYGFFKEKIELKSYIDEDLIFKAELKSENKGEDNIRTWEHENLKFSYKLPVLSRR